MKTIAFNEAFTLAVLLPNRENGLSEFLNSHKILHTVDRSKLAPAMCEWTIMTTMKDVLPVLQAIKQIN